MDLEEWDLLSDEGFIDLHEKGANNNLSPKSIPNTTLIDMNYFQKFNDPPKKTGVVIPVPINLGSQQDEKTEEKIPEEEEIKFPIKESLKTDDHDHIKNQESISQVFFKKSMERNEFVDMKMDSPKSLTNNNNNKGLLLQHDVDVYRFDVDKTNEDDQESYLHSNTKKDGDDQMLSPSKKKSSSVEDDHCNEGLNVWKLAMTGIGALFSFGFAAVTVSVIVLGNRHKENCKRSKKEQLHFQLYSHDKRLKQVVRHATKLNEAISAMRGAPVTRAHITIGGYHESL